jgi:hypothetical protein
MNNNQGWEDRYSIRAALIDLSFLKCRISLILSKSPLKLNLPAGKLVWIEDKSEDKGFVRQPADQNKKQNQIILPVFCA